MSHFTFVEGWVESTPSFVGFRCTQPNLHFAGVIAKCETQQQHLFIFGNLIFSLWAGHMVDNILIIYAPSCGELARLLFGPDQL